MPDIQNAVRQATREVTLTRSDRGKIEEPKFDSKVNILAQWKPGVSRENVRRNFINQSTLAFDREYIDPDYNAKNGHFDLDPGKIRLAIFSSNLRIEGQVGPDEADLHWEHSGTHGLVTPASNTTAAEMRAARAKELDSALDANADIVAFSEFAHPPLEAIPPALVRSNPFGQDFLSKCSALHLDQSQELIEQSNLAKETTAPFAFLGSSHCEASRYNVGIVYPGPLAKEGWVSKVKRFNPIDERRKEMPQVPGTGPIIHKKRFPSYRNGEAARTPDDFIFKLYHSRFGRIAVLICSDVIDLNQITSIINHNHLRDTGDQNRISFVLVPAFNESELLYDACRDLSAAAQAVVALVNAGGKRTRVIKGRPRDLPASEIFFDGNGIPELRDFHLLEFEGLGSNGMLYEINMTTINDIIKRNNRAQAAELSDDKAAAE